YVGQGANGAADRVGSLAERLGAPVLTTTSARGLLAEDHPLSLAADPGVSGWNALNACIASADLVLALGVKLSHNGTGGFQLRANPATWVHVDASKEVLDADSMGGAKLVADVGAFADACIRALPREVAIAWTHDEIGRARDAARKETDGHRVEPRVVGSAVASIAGFFS